MEGLTFKAETSSFASEKTQPHRSAIRFPIESIPTSAAVCSTITDPTGLCFKFNAVCRCPHTSCDLRLTSEGYRFFLIPSHP